MWCGCPVGQKFTGRIRPYAYSWVNFKKTKQKKTSVFNPPEFSDVLIVVVAAGGDELQGGLLAAEHLALGREEPLHGHLPVLGLHVCGASLPASREARVLTVPLDLDQK